MAALMMNVLGQIENEEQTHRVFKERINILNTLSDAELVAKYRLNREAIIHLCNELEEDLKWPSNKSGALSVEIQILTALRFYASGSFQNVIADAHNIHISSVSRCINRVSRALSQRINNYITFPSEEQGRISVKQGFYERANFPNVLGAIDGSLIPIKKPTVDEHLFVSRKGFHAINIQAICDAKYKFTSAVVRFPGGTHDSYIWHNSSISTKIENGEMGTGWLLGDSGFVINYYFMHVLPCEKL